MTANTRKTVDAACGEFVIESLTLLQQEVRRLARLFTSYVLRPGAGRPRHPRITLAVRMHTGGETWRESFAKCLPESCPLRVEWYVSTSQAKAQEGS